MIWIYDMNLWYEFMIWIYDMNLSYEFMIWIYDMNLWYEFSFYDFKHFHRLQTIFIGYLFEKVNFLWTLHVWKNKKIGT